MSGDSIAILSGPDHACSYLPGREARFGYVAPEADLSPENYRVLLEQGFRRSGNWVYRPHCRHCSRCIPVRLPVADFRLSRGQRRVQKRNADVTIRVRSADFDESHYQLYTRYLAARHPTGNPATRDDYWSFFGSNWAETHFVEFRTGAELLCVAVIDYVPGALSAVYTFFDPAAAGRSPGSLAILWQIGEARRLCFDWVYLGYWISGCRKMLYKERYRPLEACVGEQWHRFDVGEPLPLSVV